MQIDPVSLERIYPELRRLARRQRRQAGRPTAFETTELIHEAWIRLGDGGEWIDRGHYLATAARAMRFLLIDAARARARFKRIAGDQRVSMPSSRMLSAPVPDDRLIALDDLLERLDARDPRLAAIVECRYFAGYSVEETAQALGINDRTVRRDWVKAKAWLARELTA